MSDIRLNLREQLIQRMLRLPDLALPRLETVIGELERGISSVPTKEDLSRTIVSKSLESGIGGSSSFGGASNIKKDWHHAPIHRIHENGTYLVTGATYLKTHLFRGCDRLNLLQNTIFELAHKYECLLEAWAVFSNHYHLIIHSGPNPKGLKQMLSHLHTLTATELNRWDQTPGRCVWHNFWDTRLTYEKSYFARLNYVHQNPVKHGLVNVANQYFWCSAATFERMANPSQIKKIYSFGTGHINITDDYSPLAP